MYPSIQSASVPPYGAVSNAGISGLGQQVQSQFPPAQYSTQQLPLLPYQMAGNASLNAIFGNNYSAEGYGSFEFTPSSLTMGPAYSDSPLFNVPSGGVATGLSSLNGTNNGSDFGGVDLFGQGFLPDALGSNSALMANASPFSGGSAAGYSQLGQMSPGVASQDQTSQNMDASQLYGNNPISPFETLPRGTAQSVNHYGFDQYGRFIGNFFDIASNGVDKLAYRGRVAGPIDPASLRGSATIANPIIMGQVFGVGPASFAQVTDKGAYAYGGAEAYSWNQRAPGQVLLDYDGPALYTNANPRLNG